MENSQSIDLWVEERFQDFLGVRFKVKNVLYSQKSPFQTVEIVETKGHGRMLLNDGLVMVSERDEHVYHEMIAHVPLFTHPNPKRVLVIGGGDGGTVREVIRHPSVEYCALVEIDELVVNSCKEFIPQTAACLDDPRVDVKILDGVKFAKETKDRFDVILVDSTDPIGPAAPLFGNEFYSDLKTLLTDDGIIVSQGESPIYQIEAQMGLLKILKNNFGYVNVYNFTNMTYPGGIWSFTFASNGLCPLRDFEENRVKKLGLKCKWYNEGIHRGAFALPQEMKERVQSFIQTV